ncbi:cytochrome P450 [Tanacetum coccineum]
MKENFAKYGRVEDVYIAGKRNKQGKRFGFSRFSGVSNPSSFEDKLNTICIGTQKIRCNIARFQRRHNQVNYGDAKINSQLTAPQNTGTSNKASFAATLNGNLTHPKPIPKRTLNIHLEIPPLCSHLTSVVAELNSVNGALNTPNLILDEGFEDFSIKYLGGLYLLVHLPDQMSATKIIKNSTLLSHFKSLRPWSNDFRIKERLTWIAISGLPPQLWLSELLNNGVKLLYRKIAT